MWAARTGGGGLVIHRVLGKSPVAPPEPEPGCVFSAEFRCSVLHDFPEHLGERDTATPGLPLEDGQVVPVGGQCGAASRHASDASIASSSRGDCLACAAITMACMDPSDATAVHVAR